MDAFAWVTGLLLVLLEDVRAEFCPSASSYDDDMYCVYGCCGDSFDRYCCEDTYENIPLIVGLSVGGFFFIVVVIAAICACVKSANRPRGVVGVQPVGPTMVSTTGASGETCSHSYYNDIYCTSCCGSYYSSSRRYCCSGSSGFSSYTSTIETYENIPLIVGLSVGGFFFIVVVIVAICACVKSANRPRGVVGVQPVGPTMVSTTAASSQQSGYAGQIPQPPAYNAYPPPGPPSAVYPLPGPPSAVYPPPGPPSAVYPPPGPPSAVYPPPPQNLVPPSATNP
ncbi:protein shisa-4-like isoform X2 [Haliotis rufescens]|uniref:protein shisa-4-like isoform X2 n=1 Tax=Haliotis rufescens TaxID=6454 RepID=UPI00201EE23B|nr:protein shisa-4-like isoform X2 [Haliotis rufescens]